MGVFSSKQANGSGVSSPTSSNSGSFINALRSKPHKMVFVANMSLKMGAGKLAAQVGHATLGVYCNAMKSKEGQASVKTWNYHGAMKIVVKGQDADQLNALHNQANELGLFSYLVQDAGHTQIPAGSRTILGLFGPVEEVDKITGTLKLL